MSREPKPTNPAAVAGRSKAAVDVQTAGEAALVNVSGLVDERFGGFGDLRSMKTVAINVAGMTRMTSFGVRQWLKSMDSLPKTITELYMVGCPTFFVDQLNMVLNFGGNAKILTVVAPYTCPSCGVESGETIDVLAERANLAKGGLPEKECARCGGKLEFDETPESYFAFVSKYAASHISPAAAQLLGAHGLYTSAETATEKPPRIIKLVHGSVTYFRIIGTIGSMFRARPFLVGAEGEVVLDLAEVSRFDPAGLKEWQRLVKTLAGQVPAVTLVDVSDEFLAAAGSTLSMVRNVAVASVIVPYACLECGKTTLESETMLSNWPRVFEDKVCSTCGGTTRSKLGGDTLLPLQKASTSVPAASVKVVDQRAEILSRALTDANVAQAGGDATPAVGADDTLLGKYKIVRRLSEGGMAEVFLAKQVGIGGFEKPVALKRIQRKLLDSRHLAIELFLNEAKIAGRLTHPNIVQVLDVGEERGALYLAMEYVRGKDLRDVIKKLQAGRTVMPLEETLYVTREVAQALHHAYFSTDMTGKRMAVVHRDVSPQNVILGFEGTVKLLDFGVAMSGVTEHAETMIVGKWLYMSPETTMNEQIDHRSDLFSLGVILYLLCSGYMPFSGPEPKEIVKKIRAGSYKPLLQLAPTVPARLAALVDRLLAPNPDDRWQSGQDVVEEINEIARDHGLEISAPRMAYLLSQLFPDEIGSTDTPVPRTSKRISAPVESPSVTPTPGTVNPTPRSHAITTPLPTGPGAAGKPSQPAVSRTSTSSVTPTATGIDTNSVKVDFVPPPSLRKTDKGSTIRIVITVVVVVIIAVVLFVIVGPK